MVLGTPERRSLLAKAITSATLTYCNTRQATTPPRFRPAIAKRNGKRSG